jgi:hypothetical protein
MAEKLHKGSFLRFLGSAYDRKPNTDDRKLNTREKQFTHLAENILGFSANK